MNLKIEVLNNLYIELMMDFVDNKKWLIILLICFLSIDAFSQGKSTNIYRTDFMKAAVENQANFSPTVIEPSEVDKRKAVAITKYLPKDFSTDGTVDYTKEVQVALNRNRYVVFPNFPLLVNDVGLSVQSNSVIIFQEKSQIILKPSLKRSYSVFHLNTVNNVKMYGVRIIGDRSKRNIGKGGEWGMGISIKSSSNVSIYNPVIKDCWGDGIYLGKNDDRTKDYNVPNKDILIFHPLLDNNRRNGISITNALNLRLINPIISNTRGTAPQSGIDIEPNSNRDEMNNIIIENPFTFNNVYGIVLSLKHLVGERRKLVNIYINNHTDESSTVGFRVAGFNKKALGGMKTLAGTVQILNPRWILNKQYFTMEDAKGMFPNIEFRNVSAYKKGKNGTSKDENYKQRMKKNYIDKGIKIQD